MKLASLIVAASATGAVLGGISPAMATGVDAASPDRPPLLHMVEAVPEGPPPPSGGPGWRGPHGSEMGPTGFDGGAGRGRPPHGRGHRPPPGPLMLATRLSALETFIGIRIDQLDAWRTYTDALQQVARPPAPQPASGEDALSQSAVLADALAEQGRKAATLASAVDALRSRLAPEQIERLRQAGPLLPPGPFLDGPPSFDGPPEAPPSHDPRSFGPQGPGAPGSGHIPPP